MRSCFVLGATTLIACGGSTTPPETVVTDSSGVRIVQHGELTGFLTTEVGDAPVFRLGWEAGDPSFETIAAGSFLSDGSVAIFDAGGRQLYLISSNGQDVSAIGGQGEGPGEFQSGSAVETLPGDTLLIYDPALGRLSLFNRNGELVDSQLRAHRGRVYSKPGGVLSTGQLAWIPSSFVPSRGTESGTMWVMGPLTTSTPRGLESDTIAELPMLEFRLEDGRPVADPFTRFGVFDAYPGGFVWGRNDMPELRWMSETGELRQVARWEATPTPVDEDAWRRYEMVYRERFGGGAEPADEERLRERLQNARRSASTTLPLFTFLHTNPTGDVWLSRYAMLGSPTESYVVFESDGLVRGLIEFPRPLRILDVGNAHLLAVEANEWGVEAVVVYPLPE